jgi:alkylation response protein AidB-like acyl-CoA dehydrogenase
MADARAAETERLRRLPDEIAAGVVETGLPRALVPAAYGGGEHRLQDVLDAIAALAYHDASTAWCAMIAATTGLTAARLPEEWAERIYGDPSAVTGGFAMPSATAEEVDDGLIVTGRWAWGSGTHHCTWIGGGCLVGERRGAPFVFFERGQVRLLDTWHVSGLRGSGSTDYEVERAFVPAGRWADLREPPRVDGPLYRFPFMGALALGVCSVTIGLARRAQDELVDLAGGKRPAGSSRTLAERPAVQAAVARAEAGWRSAWAFLSEVVGGAWAAGAEGAPLGDEHKRLIRLAATNVTWRSAEAVDLMYHAGGGSSIHEASALQRVFRDIHVATQHGMVAERTYEPVGRMALGLPTDTAQL